MANEKKETKPVEAETKTELKAVEGATELTAAKEEEKGLKGWWKNRSTPMKVILGGAAAALVAGGAYVVKLVIDNFVGGSNDEDAEDTVAPEDE